MQKLHFIDGKLVSLFSICSVYTQSFEHLNKVGVRATMDSKLEEQRSVLIKILLLKGEKPSHSFQRLQKSFSITCICQSIFYSWVSHLREGRTKGEKPSHSFQKLQKSFSNACICQSTFYSWVSQLREGRTSMRDKHRSGRPAEAVTPTMVGNVEVLVK